MRVLKHAVVVLLALFLTLGIPCLVYVDVGAAMRGADAVTQATAVLPDTPSGEFLVYINRVEHPDSLEQWKAFFAEEDYGILLEDVRCMAISGDATGVQLARRYQSRLVKDQMTLRQENGVLVASRMERGLYDMVIVSREMAEVWQLTDSLPAGTEIVTVQGDIP